MELRQLEHFVAVADERNFTRAAARVHISQSGLSASIRALERELGATLFDRTTRTVELTEHGRALYSGARRTLAAADDARDLVQTRTDLEHARVAVGAVPTYAGLELAVSVRRLRNRYPNTTVAITVAPPTLLIEQVRREMLDLAFVTLPRRPPLDVGFTAIATYPVVLTCSPGHRLADRGQVELRELAGEVFVDFPPDSSTRATTDVAFELAQVERSVPVVADEIHAVLELVAHGIGIAVVPRPLAQVSRVPIRMLSITDGPTWTLATAAPLGGLVAPAARELQRLVADCHRTGPEADGLGIDRG